ncbi:MAG: DedA family protein [Melioribacteraceae bacterium]|nr:DedA family protein [Melioribacteraceae bacterium]
MLEQIVVFLNSQNVVIVYLILFAFAFIENLFPPSPSDIVVVIGSTILAHSPAGFIPLLLVTSIGSSLGFIVMYFIGDYLGLKLIRANKIKFITQELLQKADKWFNRYGYKIIIVNRFLPGTRAVVSFFSGLHQLRMFPTFLLASLSSLLWYILLVFLGMKLGQNIDKIDSYLKTYSNIAYVVLGIIMLIVIYRFLIKKKKKESEPTQTK